MAGCPRKSRLKHLCLLPHRVWVLNTTEVREKTEQTESHWTVSSHGAFLHHLLMANGGGNDRLQPDEAPEMLKATEPLTNFACAHMPQMLKFYKPTEARRTDINSNQTRLCAQRFQQTPPALTALHQASKVLEIYTDT